MAAVERGPTSSGPRVPPLTQTDAITSLLSLSLAAADSPIDESATAHPAEHSLTAAHAADASNEPIAPSTAPSSTLPSSVPPVGGATSVGSGKHHRRLGSTGQTRRRLSDAREASTRPILVPSASSSAALSLASLSLSTSPPSVHTRSQSLSQSFQSLGQGQGHHQSLGHGSLPSYSYSPGYQYQGNLPISGSLPNGEAVPIPGNSAGLIKKDESKLDGVKAAISTASEVDGERNTKPISISAGSNSKAKKRGIDYKCESCAKIYRHPNCLNKHRWEHTRQWREASKFVLSKHQQVQLLEAATILSFMGTASTSLPEDRSEWPSFVSGGSLPKVEAVSNGNNSANASASAGAEYTGPTASSGLGQSRYAPLEASSGSSTSRTSTYAIQPHLVSSSVPNVSSGPRMHDYSLRGAGNSAKVTQVRPGLLGVPTVSSIDTKSSTSIPYTSPRSAATPLPSVGGGGWSLPSSSVRSQSYASRSRSRSRSRSGSDESIDADAAIDIEGMDNTADDDHVHVASASSALRSSYYGAYATPLGVSQSPSYGYGYVAGGHAPGYGYNSGYAYAGRRGAGMKREDDEMSVGFSVREEDEDEEADEEDTVHQHHKRGGAQQDSKWNGMEMELDMDMD